jgi:hypothetical protein
MMNDGHINGYLLPVSGLEIHRFSDQERNTGRRFDLEQNNTVPSRVVTTSKTRD